MTMKKPKYVKPQGGEGVADNRSKSKIGKYALIAFAVITVVSVLIYFLG